MKTKNYSAKQILTVAGWSLFVFSSCSTVKEQGEPNVAPNTTEITNDVQRRAIYENGSNVTLPQNANPIPNSDQLRLNEKASDINRKINIEDGGNNTNSPSNKPTEERPRQMPNTGNDTIFR